MWFIFALLTSLIYALYYICNQNSRLKAEIFIIYRGFLAALMATPLVLIYFHVFPWQFYAIALFQGLTISYMDYKYFQAFHEFGAENVNSVKPLTVLIIFVLWLILKPSIIGHYMATPLRSAVILAALATIIFAVMKYRHQKIGKECLKKVFPLLFLSSIIDISNKLITEYNDGYLLALTFHRVALTGYIIGTVNLLIYQRKNICLKELISLQNLRRGSFIILLVLSMITINLAMHYTPNPAYTTAVIYLSVVWIMFINKIQILAGKKLIYQPIEKKWIFALLISAIVLVLLTQ
ncbi:MAG: hypothetical protein J6039_00645 [Alphaproteobacteria bacterium]|nr:hypothetical protein [Alphaproteobacteria bacterium]